MAKNNNRRLCITMTEDTYARIKQYAEENHASVSHSITELIWKAKIKESEKETK